MNACKVIFVAFVLIATAALQACSDHSPPETSDSESVSDTTSTTIDTTAAETTEASMRQIPILGNDNSETFLQNYFDTLSTRKVALSTRHGRLVIELFEDTPLHTANFMMMVQRDYFTGTEFTRIVKDFIVQGGNSERETDEIKRLLIGNYLIDPEIHDKYLHRKGALAMARSYDDNPEKRSSAYDFYIVVGRTFNDPQIMAMAREHEMEIPEWKRKIYREIGGAPHLDGQHTVFGQVVEGMDVLEKMGNTPTDERNWPLESLVMKMEAVYE